MFDYSGISVSSAGDVNGDGFDDLLIGAPYGDASGNGRINAGDSYVIFGTASVTNVTPTLSLNADGVSGAVLTIDEQRSAILTGTITDPGTLDVFTLVIDWGDPLSPGNMQTLTFSPPHTPGSGTLTFTVIHTYLDDNPTNTASDPYTIKVSVNDDDEPLVLDTKSTTVTVNNVAPTAYADGPDAVPAVGQAFSTDEDTPFITGNILTNEVDPANSFNPLKGENDDILTVVAINGIPRSVGVPFLLPSGAELTINADGTLFYDPNNVYFYLAAGQMATDIFSYTIDDGDTGIATAFVTITIIGNNDIWVDVDNDCVFDPGLDIDVTSLAEDGVFDTRTSSGFYSSPVLGAGLGINAVLNLPGNMNFTANGTICILHSELAAGGMISVLSVGADISVTESEITAVGGISLITQAGTVTVDSLSTLLAIGPSADILIIGPAGITVS